MQPSTPKFHQQGRMTPNFLLVELLQDNLRTNKELIEDTRNHKVLVINGVLIPW